MCHIILALPFLAIAIFWLLPLNLALPIYIAIVLMSLALWWLIRKSMMQRVETGREGMVGEEAEVVSRVGEEDYSVRVQGELWTARSSHALQPGELVKITAVNGMTLTVAPEPKHRVKR